MNFDLDDQQLMLRDLVARFAADRYDIDKRARYRRSPEGFAAENWAMLAELGLLGLPFSEDLGGIGNGIIDTITVAEELGRGLVGEPWLSDLLMAARLLERAGSDAQRAAWIGRIIAGEARLALAHAEQRARYNPNYVATEARDGVLNGSKTFVLAGAGVDAFLVTAREAGGVADPSGIGVWIVPSDARGLERRDYRLTDGSVACELRLHGVAAADRLPGEAAAALADTFDEARIAACAEMVGIMDMLLNATIEHVRTRKQFGQPIGSFQAIQHRMAQLYVRLEQSRSHLLRAALASDDGGRSLAIAGAKAFVSENAVLLGEDCIQLHGGMGVTEELPIGHGHKRILLLANLFGDPEAELARYVQLAA
ncbi:acyl-CoA dehydrogenase [Sphingomonas sp. 1P06PA]|uniref:acyl-CoA dehydrogenase family protein n=1 Tax=Sphingomonas sp. 1P06PA TaxID=554121 RepID=UPI0039A45BCC